MNYILAEHTYTNDFWFRDLDDINSRDAIVIFNPVHCIVESPYLLRSRKTIEEHIEFIRTNNIKKTIIVADDIRFLRECPSLEYLWVIPSDTATDFDYSPVYDLPNLKWFTCDTEYGSKVKKFASIDYSRIKGLKRLAIGNAKEHLNVKALNELQYLSCDFGYPNSSTLTDHIPVNSLLRLSLCQSHIQSLEGIEVATKLRGLDLAYNRRLTDISALSDLKDTLTELVIQSCGKIRDFSVLSELHNMQFLTLSGSNVLPDLSFLKNMPNLKFLKLTMDVKDGDLSLCENVSAVYIRNRKHFSHKDKELPKNAVSSKDLYPFDF